MELLTSQLVTSYENTPAGARVVLADGSSQDADVVIAADGLHSVARQQLIGDATVNSAYVAYRAALPIDQVLGNGIARTDVVVYIGPRCHFVQYPLRGGEMLNQVAVFQSPRARDGREDWGTPDELDAAFGAACENVRKGIPLMWRDRWWRMYDRDPITSWVHGRVALLGDAAHPPLQYMAQGAIMAIEDGWVLGRARRPRRPTGTPRWPRIRRCAPSTAGGWCSPRASGATCGTSTGPSGCSVTPSCAPGTPTITASPTGSTGPPR